MKKIALGYGIALGLLVWGVLVFLFVGGCAFLGLLLMGTGCAVALYQWLSDRKRQKPWKILRLCYLAAVALLLVLALITGVFVYRAGLGSPEISCDAIIVLGAGVNGEEPSLSLWERIQAAYDYLEAHPDCVAVLSGGQGDGEDITEAECMFRELTALGIDPQRLILEEKAESTQENLACSLPLLEETGCETLGLVSSDYHLCRAGLMAKDLGLSPVGIPARTTYPHLYVNYFLREIVGIWYYMLFGG